jgi:hypothetical protein
MAFGLLLGLFELVRRFGAGLPLTSLVRVGLAVAAAAAVGRIWPGGGFLGGKLGTLISLGACGLVYVVVVLVTGEVRPADLMRRRRAG